MLSGKDYSARFEEPALSELLAAFLALGVGYLWGRSDRIDVGPWPWRLRLGPRPSHHVPASPFRARRGPASRRPVNPSPDPDA